MCIVLHRSNLSNLASLRQILKCCLAQNVKKLGFIIKLTVFGTKLMKHPNNFANLPSENSYQVVTFRQFSFLYRNEKKEKTSPRFVTSEIRVTSKNIQYNTTSTLLHTSTAFGVLILSPGGKRWCPSGPPRSRWACATTSGTTPPSSRSSWAGTRKTGGLSSAAGASALPRSLGASLCFF